ncbi:MAG TPA: serine/threonine-protein kinase [Tepidisphaeraceae bacterium]|nr:serine/threonine-protein kinase [Tepidisphaeraceae bacterium]
MATTEGARQPQGSTPIASSAAASAAVASKSGSSSGGSNAGAAAARSLVGRRVKRFRLLDELGEGAMGRVYVAEDTVLKRHVALKLLPAKHRDGRPNHRTERLVREARSAATLEHPNVVTIHEIDQVSGVHYIAMELVEGGNLERLVQMSGPMEIERACQLAAEAAEALSHAHQRGIIHRDIKPANLLLTRSGRCKVADFGLACFDDPSDATARAKTVGTPHYIPPEIAIGEGATEKSDLYSLGCSLWFLLTGRPPFTGTSTRDVLKAHVSQPLPDLRRWRPDAPDRLIHALEQACAKHPNDRFSDAARFAAVLRTFTISTGGSNGAVVPVAGSAPAASVTLPPTLATPGIPVASGPHLSGMVMMSQTAQLRPVSAAAASLPAPEPVSQAPVYAPPAAVAVAAEEDKPLITIPAAMIWTGCGTIVGVACISLGIWLARTGPQKVEASPTPAAASAVAAPEAPAHAAGDAESNVLTNGAFDDADGAEGAVSGWFVAERCKPHVRLMTEGANRFLRLTNDDYTTTMHAAQKIDVDPSWRSVTVSARMRASHLKPGGKKTPDDARVAFSFRDANDKQVGNWPAVPMLKEDSPWAERVVNVPVPAGAKKLYLQCTISYATGTVDFDDVRVVPQK